MGKRCVREKTIDWRLNLQKNEGGGKERKRGWGAIAMCPKVNNKGNRSRLLTEISQIKPIRVFVNPWEKKKKNAFITRGKGCLNLRYAREGERIKGASDSGSLRKTGEEHTLYISQEGVENNQRRRKIKKGTNLQFAIWWGTERRGDSYQNPGNPRRARDGKKSPNAKSCTIHQRKKIGPTQES